MGIHVLPLPVCLPAAQNCNVTMLFACSVPFAFLVCVYVPVLCSSSCAALQFSLLCVHARLALSALKHSLPQRFLWHYPVRPSVHFVFCCVIFFCLRLYHVYRKRGEIPNFGTLLRNVFEPLFDAVKDPQKHRKIFLFLQAVRQCCGY